MWTVVTGKPVGRKLEKIPNPDKEIIKQTIHDLESEDKHEALDIKPLVRRDEHRLRVGGWRLLLKISEEEKTIFIRTLATRGDVYKK